jgi:hypothetical protein
MQGQIVQGEQIRRLWLALAFMPAAHPILASTPPGPKATWRGLETWHGRDSVTLANERASNSEHKLRPKPARQSSTLPRAGICEDAEAQAEDQALGLLPDDARADLPSSQIGSPRCRLSRGAGKYPFAEVSRASRTRQRFLQGKPEAGDKSPFTPVFIFRPARGTQHSFPSRRANLPARARRADQSDRQHR